MSRFRCACGHAIVDITDFLPYKARFMRDEDSQLPNELLAQAIVELLQAREQGTQREFLIDFRIRYSGDTDETAATWVDHFMKLENLQDVLEDMIFEFWWGRYEDAIYECEECGRLWLEMSDGSLVPYAPESAERHVLQSRHHHPPYSNE